MSITPPSSARWPIVFSHLVSAWCQKWVKVILLEVINRLPLTILTVLAKLESLKATVGGFLSLLIYLFILKKNWLFYPSFLEMNWQLISIWKSDYTKQRWWLTFCNFAEIKNRVEGSYFRNELSTMIDWHSAQHSQCCHPTLCAVKEIRKRNDEERWKVNILPTISGKIGSSSNSI